MLLALLALLVLLPLLLSLLLLGNLTPPTMRLPLILPGRRALPCESAVSVLALSVCSCPEKRAFGRAALALTLPVPAPVRFEQTTGNPKLAVERGRSVSSQNGWCVAVHSLR